MQLVATNPPYEWLKVWQRFADFAYFLEVRYLLALLPMFPAWFFLQEYELALARFELAQDPP